MQIRKKVINQNDKSISFTHIELGSNSICFMFSGSGYNYDKPLFYYSTMAMLESNIDIVHIHYSYDEQTLTKSIEEITKIMMEDIEPVITNVIENSEYSEVIFLGKSLGTIPIALDLMQNEKFVNSKMILLTPLLKFDTIFTSIMNSQHQGLLVIGDKDPHHSSDKCYLLKNKANLKIEVIENANHSLDIRDHETSKSINNLFEIMKKVKTIL